MNDTTDVSPGTRVVRLFVSIVVLAPVTVVVGYGGGAVLTLVAKVRGDGRDADDADPLRSRLLAWPDRNRDVVRTNGRATLSLKP